MVLVQGNKYACETCIKGHRSSNCQHTDRPLYEIKKKGRPVTQCEHCRELRKTKQLHIRCICGSKDSTSAPSTSRTGKKKGSHTQISESPAFPNGLPEALEASVASLNLSAQSTGTSSDSDYGVDHERSACECDSAAECHCSTNTPRARTRLQSSASTSNAALSSTAASNQHTSTMTEAMSSHILSRIAALRPVLPRPEQTRHLSSSSSSPSSFHDPSTSMTHGHPSGRHPHESTFYSPYVRAYEHAHAHGTTPTRNGSNYVPTPTRTPPSSPNPFFDDPSQSWIPEQLARLSQSVNTQIRPSESFDLQFPIQFPSRCGCGETCSCPGCPEHNQSQPHSASNSSSPPAGLSPTAFSQCTNPGGCGACLDCTILSLPGSMPTTPTPAPPTPLDPAYPYQYQYQQQYPSIDDWIRQISSPSSYEYNDQLPEAGPSSSPNPRTNAPRGETYPWGGGGYF